jgi:periplasmic copper chaperone A
MNSKPRPTRLTAALALVLLIVPLAACTGGPAAAESIQITNAWARTSPAMATNGAVYMDIANSATTNDALTAASVDAAIAATTEIHEAVAGHGDGMMGMRPVERIDIPAGGTVALEPGGYHVMLLDLAAPLEAGSTLEVRLTFERAGEIVVTAEVREAGM